jgi:hypothetical protein
MPVAEQLDSLAQLFRDAGAAHHQAFLATNGEDPHWPCWYARWLAPRMEFLLGRRYNPDQLASLLDTVEDERKERGITDWPAYYADFFLNRSEAET